MAQKNADSSNQKQIAMPPSIKYAGWLGMLLGFAGIIYAIVLVIRDLQGYEDSGAVISGAGTALWFFIIFGVVVFAGWMLSRGARWGRGPVAMLAIIMLGIAYYMFTSHRIELAIPTLVIAVVELGLIFNKDAVEWTAQQYNS